MENLDKNNKNELEYNNLSRNELIKLESKKKTKKDKIIDALFLKLPYISGIICILEYTLIPDNSINPNPMTYIYFIICLLGLYSIYLLYGLFKRELIILAHLKKFATMLHFILEFFYF